MCITLCENFNYTQVLWITFWFTKDRNNVVLLNMTWEQPTTQIVNYFWYLCAHRVSSRGIISPDKAKRVEDVFLMSSRRDAHSRRLVWFAFGRPYPPPSIYVMTEVREKKKEKEIKEENERWSDENEGGRWDAVGRERERGERRRGGRTTRTRTGSGSAGPHLDAWDRHPRIPPASTYRLSSRTYAGTYIRTVGFYDGRDSLSE